MKLNKYIDHTLLKPEATEKQIISLCQEALQYDFASVCINSYWVALCAEQLKDIDVKVCTVIGFPLGANTTATKVTETRDAISNGATEIDMVVNIGALKSKLEHDVLNDIKAVVQEAKPNIVKVIIEACLLTDEEKVLASKLVMEAGAEFVKTSTGFSTGGATIEDVKLIKSVVKDETKIKASGGIKTPEQFKAMIEAGASRIGTSNGIKLIK